MSVAAKRKRTAEDGGSTPKRAKMSKAALHAFHSQYYQGMDFRELDGCASGTHLLGSPDLLFHSPMDELMWLEITSGTKGLGTGCIRLCAHGKDPQDVLAPRFMLPFRHVEQFLILDEPRLGIATASSEQAYRAIIVPTAAVGASPLKRKYPQVIQFSFPDQKAGKDFKGTIGEGNDNPDETYRSLITRVVNEQLAPYDKTVVDASSAVEAAENASMARIRCATVLKHEEGKKAKKDAKIKGQLFFLKTGLLFHSSTTILYLTAESTKSAMLIHNVEGGRGKEPTNISLVCPTSEPYYEEDRETGQGTSGRSASPKPSFITFNGIDRRMSTSIAQHASRYGIELSKLEQQWYSLEREQPMTGWLPRGFGI